MRRLAVSDVDSFSSDGFGFSETVGEEVGCAVIWKAGEEGVLDGKRGDDIGKSSRGGRSGSGGGSGSVPDVVIDLWFRWKWSNISVSIASNFFTIS